MKILLNIVTIFLYRYHSIKMGNSQSVDNGVDIGKNHANTTITLSNDKSF